MSEAPLSSYQLRQRQKQADPWRGRKAVSVGTVLQVDVGLISHAAVGLCARIMVEASDAKDAPPPGEHTFWLPEAMRKQQIAAPREGTRIAFVHHLYLGVRRLRDFKLAPSKVEVTPPRPPAPRIGVKPPVSNDWDDM